MLLKEVSIAVWSILHRCIYRYMNRLGLAFNAKRMEMSINVDAQPPKPWTPWALHSQNGPFNNHVKLKSTCANIV